MRSKLKSIFDESDKKKLSHLTFLILINSIFEVAGIASFIPFISVLTDKSLTQKNLFLKTIFEFLGSPERNLFVLILSGAFLVLISFSNLLAAYSLKKTLEISFQQVDKISKNIFEKYLSQPYEFFILADSAELTKNVISEVGRFVTGFMIPGIQLFAKLLVAILILFLLIVTNPFVTGIVFVLFLFAYLIIYCWGRRGLKDLGLKTSEADRMRFKIVQQAQSGIKEIKLLRKELEFYNLYSSPSKAYSQYQIKNQVVANVPRYFLEIMAFLSIFLIVAYFYLSQQSVENAIPLVSLFGIAGYRLLPAMQTIYLGTNQIRFNWSSFEIIAQELKKNEGTFNKFSENKIAKHELTKFSEIKIQDMSYRYPNAQKSALKNISLSIRSGQFVAIVGRSGAGKSTLLDLILGLINPSNGGIFVDGIPIAEVRSPFFTFVPQNIFIFDDTVLKNVAFFGPKEEIDLNRVIDCVKRVCLDSLIENELEHKYETSLGGNAIRLSGGQKQKLGIARALYLNKSKAIILDEPTSALDPISSKDIINTLVQLKKEKTIVLVTHKILSTIECDQIFYIHNGEIQDSGTYNELFDRSANFRALAQLEKMNGEA